MKTIEEVKGRCRILSKDDSDDKREHWLWGGATREGVCNIHAPDYTKDQSGETLRVQTGTRAVWHMKHGKPMAPGHRAFRTCAYLLCVNPACVCAGTVQDHLGLIARTGRFKGSAKRRSANLVNGTKNRKVTAPVFAHILSSGESTKELAARLSIHHDTINLYRSGKKIAPGHNFFGGLVR